MLLTAVLIAPHPLSTLFCFLHVLSPSISLLLQVQVCNTFLLVLLCATESTVIAIFDKLSRSQCGKQVSLCPSPPPLPIPSMKIARAKATAGDHYTDRNSLVNCKGGKHVISKKIKNTLEHQD